MIKGERCGHTPKVQISWERSSRASCPAARAASQIFLRAIFPYMMMDTNAQAPSSQQ